MAHESGERRPSFWGVALAFGAAGGGEAGGDAGAGIGLDHGVHLISGFPRAGSTLLAALLRQNPALHAEELGLRARAMRDPGVHVRADGEMLTPVSVAENRLRFEAPAGGQTLRLRSRSAIPARLLELDSADARRLAVCLWRLEIDCGEIALDDPALCDGWHQIEPSWRWTNGDAALPLGRIVTLWLQPLPAAYPLPRPQRAA